DDIAGALEILLHPLQLADRLHLLSLEPADARGFLENAAAFLGRSLQEDVDAALLDHAIGVGAGAAAQEKLFDIPEPAGLVVDEILALAVAIHPAGDLYLVAFDREQAAAIVEGHGDFGQAEAAPGRRAV